MNNAIADDLRGWLKEPYFSKDQRERLVLDSRQRELATSRTDSGYRRIKGPAGSGKSVILAARSSVVAAEGKKVLVVCFNITLLNYLRDLSVRHDASRGVVRRQIDFLNFHYWCKRVCFGAGAAESYKSLWRSLSETDNGPRDEVLNERLASLVQQIYREDDQHFLPRYDAILVDEGQDMRLSWWNALRLALKDNGEMVLAADKTQNIYSTAAAWTEDTMATAGFYGPWSELKISYRLPPIVIPLVCRFAEEFLTDEEIDLPLVEERADQLEFADLYPVELRWVQVREPSDGLDVCDCELKGMMQRLRSDTAVPDITVLSGIELGQGLTDLLRSKGVNVLDTFDSNERLRRRQKRAFFQGAAQVKATTLHSFKGWEARHILLYVDRIDRSEERALLYAALTRIRRHEKGSALTVVSTCRALLAYGQSWPDFVEV